MVVVCSLRAADRSPQHTNRPGNEHPADLGDLVVEEVTPHTEEASWLDPFQLVKDREKGSNQDQRDDEVPPLAASSTREKRGPGLLLRNIIAEAKGSGALV